MARCDSSPRHSDDVIEFDIDKPVSILLDGDPDTVREITDLITAQYRKPGGRNAGGRDSNRTVTGGYGVRFTVYGK